MYTVELTDIEDLAMQSICVDTLEWISNAVKNRAKLAYDELVQNEVARRFRDREPIPGSSDEMILDAYNRGIIIPYKTLHEQRLLNMQNRARSEST
jgi:hypothetical protein